MAKASSEIRTVTRMYTKEVAERVVTLTLTLQEAEAVRTVCGRITGHDEKTARRHTTAVYNALAVEGVSSRTHLFRGAIEAC